MQKNARQRASGSEPDNAISMIAVNCGNKPGSGVGMYTDSRAVSRISIVNKTSQAAAVTASLTGCRDEQMRRLTRQRRRRAARRCRREAHRRCHISTPIGLTARHIIYSAQVVVL
jgi:hypothetical protein